MPQRVDDLLDTIIDRLFRGVDGKIGLGGDVVVRGHAREMKQFAGVGLGILAFGVAFATDLDGCCDVDDEEAILADPAGNWSEPEGG